MTEIKNPPPHWHTSVWPAGWNFETDKWDDPQLEQVGFVLLPQLFYLAMGLLESEISDAAGPTCIVTFVVEDEKLVTREMYALDTDLIHFIDRVKDFFPMDGWKSFATQEMLKFLALDENRQIAPDLVRFTPEGKMIEMVMGKSRTAQRGSSGGRRHRITEEHLREVARIYSEAIESGEPPTRAVAEMFGVAHSTAAKWVGTARSKGLLEGVAQKWGRKQG